MNHTSVTQAEIARISGVHVSTANKVLNRTKGPAFRQKTVDRTLRVAKKMGYRFHRPSKRVLIDTIKRLVASHPGRKTSRICRDALDLVAMAEPGKKS